MTSQITFLVLAATAAMAQEIVPGERVGPVTRTSTEVQLLRELGSEAVVADVDVGEGMYERGLIVYPNDPQRKLAVVWNRESPPHPASIQICYQARERCTWRTREGVTFGTTLEQLVRLNGRDFLFVRWGSDVGGNVTSFRTGNLARFDREGGRLWLSLQPRPDVKLTLAEERSVYGYVQEISSGLATARKLAPRVTRMWMYFAP